MLASWYEVRLIEKANSCSGSDVMLILSCEFSRPLKAFQPLLLLYLRCSLNWLVTTAVGVLISSSGSLYIFPIFPGELIYLPGSLCIPWPRGITTAEALMTHTPSELETCQRYAIQRSVSGCGDSTRICDNFLVPDSGQVVCSSLWNLKLEASANCTETFSLFHLRK